MIEKIKKLIKNQSLYIIGHNNPDIDSIFSGYIFEQYLKQFQIKAKYIIPDRKIDKDTLKICQKYHLDITNYQNEIPNNANLFLLDHYKTEHQGNVIGAIDHHATIEKIKYPIYINKRASSTTKLLYDLMEASFFNQYLIELVVMGILVDTVNFRNKKTTKETVTWVENIVKKYQLDYSNLTSDALIVDDLLNLEEAAVNGFKKYNYDNIIIKSSYIQINQFDIDKINQIVDILISKLKDIYMWVFIVNNLKNNTAIVYKIKKDKTEKLIYDSFVSRGKTIMPNIEKELKEGII
ncbi:MAG: DHH family phosphoesterase [Bacilli bacterium]